MLKIDTVLLCLTGGSAFIEPRIQTLPMTVCLPLKAAYTEYNACLLLAGFQKSLGGISAFFFLLFSS